MSSAGWQWKDLLSSSQMLCCAPPNRFDLNKNSFIVDLHHLQNNNNSNKMGSQRLIAAIILHHQTIRPNYIHHHIHLSWATFHPRTAIHSRFIHEPFRTQLLCCGFFFCFCFISCLHTPPHLPQQVLIIVWTHNRETRKKLLWVLCIRLYYYSLSIYSAILL